MTGERAQAPWVAFAFAGCYLLAGALGRTTVLEGTSLSLVWPAAGVPLLWFLLRGATARSIDTPLLAIVAFTVMAASGAGVVIAVLLAATNVGQTLLAATLLRRWCPELYGAGGSRPLDSPRVLALLMSGVGLAVAAGAAVGTLGLLVVGEGPDLVTLALWFGRNLCGALVVVTVGLLLAQWLAQPRPRPRLMRGGTGGAVELAAAGAFAVAVHAAAFVFDELPLAFALLAATVWFATRFATLLVAAAATLAGVSVVAATLAGVGPFVAAAEPVASALLAQLYVVTTLVVGLALATGRDESMRLTDELRAAESDAIYQARLLDAVIGNIDAGIAVVDDLGEVRFRNAAAAAVVGDGPDLDAAGEIGVRLRTPVVRALGGEHVRGLDLAVGDALERILDVSAAPLPPDGRRGRGRVLLLLRDATTEHAQRAELLSFAGVVAHDLRNPLAAIEGWTDMIDEHLEHDELDLGVARRFVARVRSSSVRMRDLIEGLLAHAQSRDRDLKLVPLDVAAVVAEVARARGADGEVRSLPVPPVRADPVLVRQLIDNLLGNALKYVEPGTRPDVRVSARTLASGQVAVAVADNGIGLPEGEHEKVFTEFHRAHHRDYDGSGLGLAICRRIVTRHGGTIRACDNPDGPGTVFEFTLPAA